MCKLYAALSHPSSEEEERLRTSGTYERVDVHPRPRAAFLAISPPIMIAHPPRSFRCRSHSASCSSATAAASINARCSAAFCAAAAATMIAAVSAFERSKRARCAACLISLARRIHGSCWSLRGGCRCELWLNGLMGSPWMGSLAARWTRPRRNHPAWSALPGDLRALRWR
ncbi:hypothetical protein DFH94DRAFT_27378 [Russula ochroleuca]|uniref:Uncharacterized protein n=1 Tax=Russula ochroleuca TaxID=152965 RepID=A0A9P5N7Z3_9AGAM|nr:hypothetical protein DFH94DRAFT_27378 [Russula ochroleuca]